MTDALAWTAAAACALFAGGALYASLVEHPARMACGAPMAIAQFRMSYPRGAALQAPLAVAGALAGAGVWLAGGPLAWLLAAVALGVVVPLTLWVIAPTNDRLRDPALAPDTPEAHRLLRRWGHLHHLRTALSLAALALMLRLLVAH